MSNPSLVSYADSVARSNGIPPNMFARFVSAESGWQTDVVSSKGAVGIVQIVPQYHPTVDPTDPYASLDYAGRTLQEYYRQFGSWESSFAAWNAGPGAVTRYGGVPPYSETQSFVKRIVGDGTTPTIAAIVNPTPTEAAPGSSSNPSTSYKWIFFAVGAMLLLLAARNMRRR